MKVFWLNLAWAKVYNAIPYTICVHMFMCACACMHVYVCLCQLWHNDRLTVGATAPPQASRKALHSWAASCESEHWDYKLKHAPRSHHCFSKYFQSQCLEIIALGQGWDWFPKQGLGVVVIRFYWRVKMENRLHLLRKGSFKVYRCFQATVQRLGKCAFLGFLTRVK